MALTPGARLGPYEIQAPLGAGGMGEVYKARDTRLDRIVALKVLPPLFAEDAAFVDRFDREARAIATLSHPHICTLFDVGHESGTHFLVMEHLDGRTLADRLEAGPLPVADALRYAVEIADALGAAHRAGIVHRDLKPGNVMLTKAGAKLLDFGLAKETAAIGTMTGGHQVLTREGMSAMATTPPNLTAQGTIVGTFQYMAPEQLEGGAIDARTDIFAFGALLHEMLTGRKAFSGKSQATLIAAIIGSDPPPISALLPVAPPALDRVVRKCLAKDPDERWQSAKDLQDELAWIETGGSRSDRAAATAVAASTPAGGRGTRVAWGAAAILLLALIGALILGYAGRLQPTPPPAVATRSSVLPPDNVSLADLDATQAFSLSPDGRWLVFGAVDADRHRTLWLRHLDSMTAQPLSGTDGASAPFWSPDSRFIAFTAQAKLKKIDIAGGPPTTLADTSVRQKGTWNRNDVILFLPKPGPIYQIAASGGAATPVTTIDATSGEASHTRPFFLPDGRHFLFFATRNAEGPIGTLYAGSVDSGTKAKPLPEIVSMAEYAQGQGLFLRDRTLMAQPFDVDRLEFHGEAVPIAEQVDVLTRPFSGAFSVSASGSLVYRTGSELVRSQLTWFDRRGKELSKVGDVTDQMSLELSPDGTRVVVSVLDGPKNARDLWLYDLGRGLRTRFTFDPSDELIAAWSPDGSQIVLNSRRNGRLDLYTKPSSGAGTETALFSDGQNNLYPMSWSPDGRFLFYFNGNASSRTGNDVWALPMIGDRKPRLIVQTEFNETYPQLSPDGRWIAYSSNESGRNEVYVAPATAPGGKWQVSADGGSFPRWRRDGKELFYLRQDQTLMAADANGQGTAFAVGAVQPLFETRARQAGFAGSDSFNYAVSADGQRFLVNAVIEATVPVPITLLTNWTALKK